MAGAQTVGGDPVDAVPGPPPVVSLELIEVAAQQRILAYDRAGDGHYGTVSAFIKSMRGNDVDATLYWLATMVAAGEDPRFIMRRIVICASEDVGNADPRALQVAVAAAGALELVGLPEAQYALAQAASYVASAPKSNRVGQAYYAALADVEAHGSQPVPPHLLHGVPSPDEDPRHRGRLRIPPRLRGGRRRTAVPAGPPPRPPLLRTPRIRGWSGSSGSGSSGSGRLAPPASGRSAADRGRVSLLGAQRVWIGPRRGRARRGQVNCSSA